MIYFYFIRNATLSPYPGISYGDQKYESVNYKLFNKIFYISSVK
jgi:hypothetical protein